MPQRHLADRQHIILGGDASASQGSVSSGGLGQDDIGTMPGDMVVTTQRRYEFGGDLVEAHPVDHPLSSRDYCRLVVLVLLPMLKEPSWICVVVETTTNDFSSDARVSLTMHFDAQPESVEQLGPERPFLGVHGSHQHETAGQRDCQPLSLDSHHSSTGVDNEIDEMVVEEVDFVDVEHAAVDLA